LGFTRKNRSFGSLLFAGGYFLRKRVLFPPDMAKWCQAYVKAAITPEPHLAFKSHGIA
jgi:hypothetical protein